MTRPRFVIVASVLACLGFVGVNLAAFRWLAPVRADFTTGHLYTLSASARDVVRRLGEPVELELVFSRASAADYPALRAHAGRVRELLAEVASKSAGKVQVREIDPPPFSEDEDRVALAGVQPLNAGEGDPLYLGVIGRNSVDDEIVIPFLSPDRDSLLEYDLVRLIAQLDNPDPARIAVITSLPAFGGDGRSEADALLLREMARAFRITPVLPDFAALPADTDVLVVIHPPALNDWQTYLIDQFLVHGGRALLAFDPAAIAAAEQGRPDRSGPGLLATTLGVDVAPDIVADPALALPIEVDAGQGRRRVERDPRLLGLQGDRLSSADPVTADLSRSINLSNSGALVATPGVALEPLLTASPPGPGRAAPILAARRTGLLTSAFASPPPVAPGATDDDLAAALDFLRQGKTPAEVILLADTDLLDARLFANPADGEVFADNAAFVLNALDNLAGDPALMALRSRTPEARPMTRVDALVEADRARLAKEEPKLRQQIDAITARINADMSAPAGANLLRENETEALGNLRAEAQELRASLRGLQRAERTRLARLEQTLMWFNVWLPPLLAALAGVGVFLWRARRRRRA